MAKRWRDEGNGGGGFFESSPIQPLRVSLLTLKANGGIHYGGIEGERHDAA
jgi:hypothetical protein